MTWVIGIRGGDHGLALFDTLITSGAGPVSGLGIYKVQGIAYNAIAGFAGSVEIGLDVLEIMGAAASKRQAALPDGVRLAIDLEYIHGFASWFQGSYAQRYSRTSRNAGLEMVFICTDPNAEMHEFPTQGLVMRCPRQVGGAFELEPLELFQPISIGSGSLVPAYQQALINLPKRAYGRFSDRAKNYELWRNASRQINSEVTRLLEQALTTQPISSVGQHLCCSVISSAGLFGPFYLGSKPGRLVNTMSQLRAELGDAFGSTASLVG
jgi:hypothetical protein